MAEKKKGRIGRWFKEMGSELKKVIWAKPAAVLKQTGVVLPLSVLFLPSGLLTLVCRKFIIC